ATTKRLIVILNDNEWSIARNVGAIAKYLNELITQPAYQAFHRTVEDLLERVPWGHKVRKLVAKAKRETKDFLVEAPSGLFESYGLRYVGPIDGHNLEELTRYLEFCKQAEEPVLLHVLTTKGKGYDVAMNNPEKFHGTSPFEVATGQSKPAKPGTPQNYQDVFGEALTRFAKKDSKIVGITAAMPSGTGLNILEKQLPNQFFDVGIAEEHAVLFAAGMATQGLKPVCAIYSTFLQRGFDPIVHDVCLQNLPVVFCMDRAGLSPNDGPTHHGLFDFAYLRSIPNTVIMQPKDEDELVDMLHTGLKHTGPAFIRYPRGAAMGVGIKATPEQLPLGKAEVLAQGRDIAIWALGPWVVDAMKIADLLEREHGVSVSVVNARFVKPLDAALLNEQAQTCKLFVTLEDHAQVGGLGSAIMESLQSARLPTPVEAIGWPDKFVDHGSSVDQLRSKYGLDQDTIVQRIVRRWAPAQTSSAYEPAVAIGG
ncbi:MAG: 1-deoxy-D-xylulose-5-phosphate synthase, partial [Verrucomicrobia bacterium 21-51-4]